MEHICYIIGAWHGEDACIRPREGDFVIAADGGYAALQADSVITHALGPHVSQRYVSGKLREWEEYRAQVSQWELDKYLVSY